MGLSPQSMSNIYRELGVEPLVNVAGNATLIGGLIMPPDVTDAMAAASRHFVDIAQLQQAVGRRLAELIGAEAAHVCACASAGITLMAAACMTGTDLDKIARLPDTREEVVVARRLGEVLAEQIPPACQPGES